jgi:hypothetical protein
MTLQCLVLDFRSGKLVVRCLYRSKGDSNPGTKGRRSYAHARAEKAVTPSPPHDPKSATLDPCVPTGPRGWREPRVRIARTPDGDNQNPK